MKILTNQPCPICHEWDCLDNEGGRIRCIKCGYFPTMSRTAKDSMSGILFGNADKILIKDDDDV